MAYDFHGKPVPRIVAEFTSIFDSKGSAMEVASAFEALERLGPALQHAVIDDLEDKLIAQAKQDGKAWADVTATLEIIGEGLPQNEEKYALLDDLERLKPMTEALLYISYAKDERAQPWTKTFAKEYIKLSDGHKDTTAKLANLYIDVCEAAEDLRLSAKFLAAREEKARASLAAGHTAVLTKQQELNKRAAVRKLRLR